MRLALRPLSSATLAIVVLLAAPATASGLVPTRQKRPLADSPLTAKSGERARSPQGPPLVATGLPAQSEESDQGVSLEPADPLVTNGLGSPSCRSVLGTELDPNGRRDCENSGFVAAPAPTDNYGLDVHIDAGLLPLSGGNLLSTVQSMFVTPEWLGVVWLVHAMLVMLEWAFAVDLIDSGEAPGLAAGLSRAEAGFTTPLLALALSISSVLVAYQGLVRRRVAQTLGEVALTLAMLAGGLWLMLDPAGTIGALGRLSDRAALGVLAVAAEGSPAVPGRALGTHLGGLFSAAIEGPWCYLEFGNVAWCRERRRLEPPLRRAALNVASRETEEARCHNSCGEVAVDELRGSARMLREARTNGEFFLALPPNGPARNSINDDWSLLRALCGGSDATDCSAPGASEAEFRTNAGTWPRVSGLILISLGLSGMLLLFGYVAMRLLTAALMGVLFLLMAPGIVLIPALGERGRQLFRAWLARLFGAVVSKLVFAFVLGVLFASTAVIGGLSVLGWWAQWLLLSAFWWTAFLRRHDLLSLAPGLTHEAGKITSSAVHRKFLAREATERLGSWRRRRRGRTEPLASVERQPAVTGIRGGGMGHRPAPVRDTQAARLLEQESHDAPAALARAGKRIERRAPRLERLEAEMIRARAGGQTRRAVSLALRAERLRADTVADEQIRGAATRIAQGGDALLGGRLSGWSRHLDAQAGLRASAERGRGASRDYGSLAGLANLSRERYADLTPREQRIARLKIDRELASRRERLIVQRTRLRHSTEEPAGAWRAQAGPQTPMPVRRRSRSPSAVRPGSAPGGSRDSDESAVMRDARAVAEGRKRQLGYDRP